MMYKQICHNGNTFRVVSQTNSSESFYINYTVWQENMCCINGQIVEGGCPTGTQILKNSLLGASITSLAAKSHLLGASATNTQIFATSMSYAPTIAYCNMFSIFYLEIISITKLVSGKTKSDSYLGMAVNIVISGFYFLLFLAISLFQYGADQIHGTNNT